MANYYASNVDGAHCDDVVATNLTTPILIASKTFTTQKQCITPTKLKNGYPVP